jgi:hypothetical protein
LSAAASLILPIGACHFRVVNLLNGDDRAIAST